MNSSPSKLNNNQIKSNKSNVTKLPMTELRKRFKTKTHIIEFFLQKGIVYIFN
jgi:hypothetical protein